MKILHIIEGLSGFGGTPRKLLYLVKHSNPDVLRHVFVCYMPSPLKEEFESCGAVVECLDTISPFNIFRHVIKSIERNEINVICTHFTRPLLIGYCAALVKGLPVIHNEHSSASYRKGWGRILSRMCLSRIQAVTCNSQYTLDSVHQEFSVPTGKLSVLHNPVERRDSKSTKAELRAFWGFGDDELIVGHVGGMIPQRDQRSLLLAFSQLHKRYFRSRLIMVGDGGLRNELERLCRELEVEDSVQFVGYTDRIGDYLRVMDIYVNPTLDEGFGIAVVEAMLEGLPVVLSDRGAHPELIEDGISGLLYCGGDNYSLYEKLQSLLDQPETRLSVGANAKQRALEKFPPQRYAQNFQTVASEVITSFHARFGRGRT